VAKAEKENIWPYILYSNINSNLLCMNAKEGLNYCFSLLRNELNLQGEVLVKLIFAFLHQIINVL
jgi:hypothetical protein